MGHKQTSGYHKTRVLNKIRLFDRFQSKESELDRFEKLRSCAALVSTWFIIQTFLKNQDPPPGFSQFPNWNWDIFVQLGLGFKMNTKLGLY